MENSRKSTCSPVSEDSASQQDGQDSKQSPSVRTNPTAKKFSKRGSGDMLPTPNVMDTITRSEESFHKINDRPRQGKMMAKLSDIAHMESQSSPTSETSMEQSSEGQLSLPGASPASLSLSPGSEEARKMTVTSGLKCSASLRKHNPPGLLLKMLLESSTWHSDKCFLTWKAVDTTSPEMSKATSSFRLYRLQQSTPRTEGTGSGLLHAPRSHENGEGSESFVKRNADRGDHCFSGLTNQIKMLLTPSTVNMEPGEDRLEKRTAYRESIGRHYVPGGLAEQVAMLGTPKEQDSRAASWDRGKCNLGEQIHGLSPGLKLQPAFVEWMMGFPLGFTDIGSKGSRPSGTPSSPRSHTRSSRGSQK